MPSIPIGQEINGPQNESFRIIDFLGRGAFGEVYRATGVSTGVVIAVKLLPLGEMADGPERVALLNETRAARQITHPNVVQVLYVDDGRNNDIGPYVCMEYVSGGTLASLLRGQNQAGALIPIARAVEMMIDIAQGARAINEKLIHRDIKPDNVLIEGKTLKIGDFGISKFLGESTRPETFKGGQHVAYMAPEGWASKENTYKLDVYAVGLVFFEILALRHPLLSKVPDPNNFLDWERAHLFEACPDIRSRRPETPLSLAQLLLRMAAKRPQQRPDWTEVLQVLTDPATDPVDARRSGTSQAITSAVESVVAKRNQMEISELRHAQEEKAWKRRVELYAQSCDDLLNHFQPAIEQFNQEFQFGKIHVDRTSTPARLQGVTYSLPTLMQISVEFFPPTGSGQAIPGGTVIGGAWIGSGGGRSANLILVREGEGDLYGRWIVCEVKFHPLLSNPRQFVGQFGISESTVQPFGFRSASDCYDQLRYARGGHIFNYAFSDEIENYFAELIVEACSRRKD